jgi:hypothetical protein
MNGEFQQGHALVIGVGGIYPIPWMMPRDLPRSYKIPNAAPIRKVKSIS